MPRTYHSASFVVMQIHLLPERPAPLAGIDELPAELDPVTDVVRAAAPFPVADAGHRGVVLCLRPRGMMAVIAGAGLDRALGAGPGDGVRHRRACYRVDKRSLSAT